MNKYQKNKRKSGLLGSLTHTQHTNRNISGSAIETGKDLLIGVIGGGVLGSAFGRSSLLLGLGLTFVGHYVDKSILKSIGFGMMAANGFQPKAGTVNGLEGMDGVKERVIAFKNTFSEKLYLDKILKKATPIGSIGDVQYLSYNDPNASVGQLDMGALEALERQIAQSGEDFQMRNPSLANIEGFEGAEDLLGSDPMY